MFAIQTSYNAHGPFAGADEAVAWAVKHERNFENGGWAVIYLREPLIMDERAAEAKYGKAKAA